MKLEYLKSYVIKEKYCLRKGKLYCAEHHITHILLHHYSILKKYLTSLYWIVEECYTRQKNGSNNDDKEYKHTSFVEEATDLYVMGFRIEGDLIIRYHIQHSCSCWLQLFRCPTYSQCIKR